MGKWSARLAEISAHPPYRGTDKADERGLVSVVSVGGEGGSGNFQHMAEGPALAAMEPADAVRERFEARLARLIRWGWPEVEATALAERLTGRDQAWRDNRRSCAECRYASPGRCANHRRAGLTRPEVARDWMALLQRCPGFEGG